MSDASDLTRQPIAYLHVLRADGSLTRSGHVACPHLGGSVPLAQCVSCPRFVKITPGNEAGSEELHCWAKAAGEERDDGPLVLPRMTVASLMSTEVVSVRGDVSLDALGVLFLETALSALPVVDSQERLLGFVDREQLALAIQIDAPEARRPLTVNDVLLPLAVAVPETTSVTQAAAVMAFEGQQRLAVTSIAGAVVGVLSASDILSWLARADGHVLPTLCAR